ncbi:MAG: SDR family oxidoreductase [bacterium]|nr:SDR family oxidoreductase [bacterium]
MIDLGGRKVLITGGSRGIGAACCRLFARAGATVWVHCATRKQAAERVLGDLSDAADAPHRMAAADLSDRRQVDRLFDEVEREWRRLDCLVNNAGIWVRNELADLDDAKLEDTLRLNLSGVFWAAQRALPLMARSADPSIVNISSTAGQRGEAFHSPYAASKGALIAATKSWAAELAPQVRVNSVAPGWVDTDMSAEAYAGGGREAIEKIIPLGRVATAEDIAGAVLFLASPLARHVTGEILNVNGGSVLCG